ncbi:MAG: molybdopterin-binding protein [Thermoplasmataceae archaeon]
MKGVVIISIGNEIVKGRTVNTNSSEIAMSFTENGFKVEKHIAIPDECEIIAQTVKEAFATYDVTVTTGGLGPTFDDMTIKCVSEGLGKDLEINKDAQSLLIKKYEKLNLSVTEERIKMARFPVGSEIIENSIGTAPGLIYRKGSHLLFCLPGVPSEMRSMIPDVLAKSGISGFEYFSLEFELIGIMESTLAPIIKQIMKETNNIVYIKTHPTSDELLKPRLTVEMYAITKSIVETKKKMEIIKKDIIERSEKLKVIKKL